MTTVPASEEAEKGVLSCMLLRPEVLRKAVIEIQDEYFFSPARQLVFRTMASMSGDNEAVDLVTLSNRLRPGNELQKAGGLEALAELLSFAPAAAHFDHYRDILLEKWALRRLMDAAGKLQVRCQSGDTEARVLLEGAEREITTIHHALGNRKVAATRHIRAVVSECVDACEAWQTGQRAPGISTGFPIFDRYQLLLRPEGYLVIAAPTNAGKSTMVAQIISNVLAAGHRVALASIEDALEMFGHRMLSSGSRVPFSRMQEAGKMTPRDFQKYTAAAGGLAGRELQMMHHGGMTCDEFRHWARRQVIDFGAEVIALDYLQRLQPSTRRGGNTETDAVNEASYTVKELAIDLKVPFLVAVQTNRLKGRKARLDDLRQSGKIEQDATEVVLLQATADIAGNEDHEETSHDPNVSRACDITCQIAKHKNGAKGEHRLYLFGDHFRFETPAKQND